MERLCHLFHTNHPDSMDIDIDEQLPYQFSLNKKSVWSEPNLPHKGQSQHRIPWAYAVSNSRGGT